MRLFLRVSTLGWSAALLAAVASGAAAQARDSTQHAGHGAGTMGHDMASMAGHDASYMAMLTPTRGAASKVNGMAMLRGTTVQLTLAGDQADATRVWHVHKGSCDNDQGVVAAAAGSSYQPLRVGADGKAAARATLAASLVAGESYFVAVHASASDMKTVLACGALKPGKM